VTTADILLGVSALAALVAAVIAHELRRPRPSRTLICPACSNERDFDHGRRGVHCERCGYLVWSERGKTGPDPTWVPKDRR
jgi:DNA-directed RNA polymerase subunit RPC12/RpoP